jgi:hypothetical protein
VENQFNLERKQQNSSALNVEKYKSKGVEGAESLVVRIAALNVVFLDHKGESEFGSCHSYL